jgi:hypothetical protein
MSQASVESFWPTMANPHRRRNSGSGDNPPSDWKDRWLTPGVIVPLIVGALVGLWALYSENLENRIVQKIRGTDEFRKIATIETSIAAISERVKGLERIVFQEKIKGAGIRNPQIFYTSTSSPSPVRATFAVSGSYQLEITFSFLKIDQTGVYVEVFSTLYENGLRKSVRRSGPLHVEYGKPEMISTLNILPDETVVYLPGITIALLTRTSDQLVLAVGESDRPTGG